MTVARKVTPEAKLRIVGVAHSHERVAFVDSLAESTSTPAHRVTRSDVLRTIVEEGLEHVERGIALLAKQGAKPEASV